MLVIQEVSGDLFSSGEDFALAHCVSACLTMGKGIAVQFKSRYQGLPELRRQHPIVGGCCYLERDRRFIYYLVTKARYNYKPTYDTLKSSLLVMKEFITRDGVKKLAIPRIGCGLDRLQWNKVREILEEVFDDMDLQIVVYSL